MLGLRGLGGGGGGGAAVPTFDGFINDATQVTKGGWARFVENWDYPTVQRMLPKQRANIDMLLSSMFDVKQHTIVWLYFVGYKACEVLNAEAVDPDSLGTTMSHIRHILKNGSRTQIGLAPRAFVDCAKMYTHLVKNENGERNTVGLLKQFAEVLRGRSAQPILTWAHCQLMESVVQTQMYHCAFPEINQRIVSVQGGNSVAPVDYLRYHYNCGIIYTALKKYDEAMKAFTMCLTCPSDCMSMVQLESYRKYVLVSLIQCQKVVSLPVYTSGVLKRVLKKYCQIYLDLEMAFNEGKESLGRVIERGFDDFNRDKNYGLVKKVMQTLERHSVIKLTSVYTRLSIDKVSELCGFESGAVAKKIVVSMIRNGELSASIDAEGVVTFSDDDGQGALADLRSMQERIRTISQLWYQLDKQQLDLKKSTTYIKKKLDLGGPMDADLASQQAAIDAMTGGMGMGMGLGFR